MRQKEPLGAGMRTLVQILTGGARIGFCCCSETTTIRERLDLLRWIGQGWARKDRSAFWMESALFIIVCSVKQATSSSATFPTGIFILELLGTNRIDYILIFCPISDAGEAAIFPITPTVKLMTSKKRRHPASTEIRGS